MVGDPHFWEKSRIFENFVTHSLKNEFFWGLNVLGGVWLGIWIRMWRIPDKLHEI